MNRLAMICGLLIVVFGDRAEAQYTNPVMYRVPVMIDLRTLELVVSNSIAGGAVTIDRIAASNLLATLSSLTNNEPLWVAASGTVVRATEFGTATASLAQAQALLLGTGSWDNAAALIAVAAPLTNLTRAASNDLVTLKAGTNGWNYASNRVAAIETWTNAIGERLVRTTSGFRLYNSNNVIVVEADGNQVIVREAGGANAGDDALTIGNGVIEALLPLVAQSTTRINGQLTLGPSSSLNFNGRSGTNALLLAASTGTFSRVNLTDTNGTAYPLTVSGGALLFNGGALPAGRFAYASRTTSGAEHYVSASTTGMTTSVTGSGVTLANPYNGSLYDIDIRWPAGSGTSFTIDVGTNDTFNMTAATRRPPLAAAWNETGGSQITTITVTMGATLSQYTVNGLNNSDTTRVKLHFQ